MRGNDGLELADQEPRERRGAELHRGREVLRAEAARAERPVVRERTGVDKVAAVSDKT